MPGKHKRHSAQFKAKVALEALKGVKTTSELASEHQIHPAQISQWKKVAMEGLSTLFERPGSKPSVTVEEATAPLFEEIGRLKMELDWLQKKGFSRSRSDG